MSQSSSFRIREGNPSSMNKQTKNDSSTVQLLSHIILNITGAQDLTEALEISQNFRLNAPESRCSSEAADSVEETDGAVVMKALDPKDMLSTSPYMKDKDVREFLEAMHPGVSQATIQKLVGEAKGKLGNCRNNFRKLLKAKWLAQKNLMEVKKRLGESSEDLLKREGSQVKQIAALKIVDVTQDTDFIKVFKALKQRKTLVLLAFASAVISEELLKVPEDDDDELEARLKRSTSVRLAGWVQQGETGLVALEERFLLEKDTYPEEEDGVEEDGVVEDNEEEEEKLERKDKEKKKGKGKGKKKEKEKGKGKEKGKEKEKERKEKRKRNQTLESEEGEEAAKAPKN